ncbi:hypothetical protein D1003_09265 [Riemerella anatipestifer]|nr:hypothetical protein [Riemerella anatipestifer]
MINFSCSSFKSVNENKERIFLTKENIKLIDGIYLNNTEVKVLPMGYFWGKNYNNKEYESVYKLIYEQKKPYFIKLKSLTEKQIEITIYVENQVLKTYILKGKLKNGYFEQSQKTYVIPLIIFNMYHNSKFRIGKLKNDNLVTDYSEKSYAHYVLKFKNSSKNIINIEHSKLKNDSIK